jgi:hypothetical protein
MEALPAIAGSSGIRLPIIDQNGYLALATASSGSSSWSVRQIHLLTDKVTIVVSGPDTAVIINTTTLQIQSSDGHVFQMTIRRELVKPLVAAVIGSKSVVLLRQRETLWFSTREGAWHHFNGLGSANKTRLNHAGKGKIMARVHNRSMFFIV